MGSLKIAAMAALLGVGGAAIAAAPTKINIQGVLREAQSGPIYFDVVAGDLDGDGVADKAVIKLVCTGGDLKQAFYTIKSPRDSASGQASGKRQHGAVTFIKEWGPSTPQLMAFNPTYDVKMLKGARTAPGGDGWSAISLGDSDGLCAAAADAATKAVKTKSNIQDN